MPSPIPQATAPHLDETDPITTPDVMDEPYWTEQSTQKQDINLTLDDDIHTDVAPSEISVSTSRSKQSL